MFSTPIPLGRACRLFAQEKPEANAIICGESSLTWLALERRTNRIAHALQAMNVRFGDIVALALPNSLELVEACVAIWKLGATPLPLSSKLTAVELEHIAAIARPVALFANDEAAGIGPVVSVRAMAESSDDESPLADQIAPSWLVSATSGSTGLPKLIASGYPAQTNARLTQAWRMSERDTVLIAPPLWHAAPFVCCFFGLFCGATVVLMPGFAEEGTLAAIERYKATWLLLVPTMMSRLWRLPADVKRKYSLSSVRTVWHVGAPCPQQVKQAWIEWFGPDAIWEVYSATDASACTVISGSEWLEHRGSVGRVADGEIRIAGEQQLAAAPGTLGEILTRRKSGETASYRVLGSAHQSPTDAAWVSTGDIGCMDPDGYLYIADRRVDMILVGGTNVYPAEVEAALEEHPAVSCAVVIGLPDDDMGNRVHAIVELRSAATTQELEQHLALKLAPYKRPRTFEFAREPLRNEAGKFSRGRLREERIPSQVTATQWLAEALARADAAGCGAAGAMALALLAAI